MFRFLFVFFVMSFTSSLWAQSLNVDFNEKQSHAVLATNIVFLGHATAFWDGNRKTEAASRQLIELGHQYNYDVIATAAAHMTDDPYLAGLHFFDNEDIDLLVSSRAGSHRLQFPNLKTIFFVGGNLNRCLCEGIRDVAIGLYQNSDFDEVNFVLVTDGIYAAYNPFSPIREESVALDFTRRFFIPSFNCPLQNWGRATEKRVKMPGLQIDVYFSDAILGSLDTEPQDDLDLPKLTKKINLYFITSDQIETFMQGFQ